MNDFERLAKRLRERREFWLRLYFRLPGCKCWPPHWYWSWRTNRSRRRFDDMMRRAREWRLAQGMTEKQADEDIGKSIGMWHYGEFTGA